MILRKIVAVIGAVVVLVGLMEIVIPGRMLALSEAMMTYTTVQLLALPELAIGVVLIAAALKQTVGLRLYVLIVGFWLVIVSVILFAAPGFVIDLIDALLLNRAPHTQLVALWVSGLVRIVMGGALMWAVMRPPRGGATAAVEHRRPLRRI